MRGCLRLLICSLLVSRLRLVPRFLRLCLFRSLLIVGSSLGLSMLGVVVRSSLLEVAVFPVLVFLEVVLLAVV